MRIGVITFPGSLDDRDAARAIRHAGAEPVALWHREHDLQNTDAIVLPGGFSYGDYLRAGALASLSPIMTDVIRAANKGVPVLGICNGFQMLTEGGLLPGGLVRNEHGRFVCRDQELRVDACDTTWTHGFDQGSSIVIPLKSGEGRFVATHDELSRLVDEQRVVVSYQGLNPNGSMNNIAGVCNERRNVVGLMPHPEHAIEPGFGPDTAHAMRSGTDGLAFFTSVIHTLVS